MPRISIRTVVGAICAMAALAHSSAAAEPSAAIQYKLGSFKTKEGKAPTFVAWVETKDGKDVATVYAAQKMAQWQMKNKDKAIFKHWAKTSMKSAKTSVDAVSKATPSAGSQNTIVWNLKDADGAAVPDGAYVLKFEAVVQGPENAAFPQVTSLPFVVGGRGKRFRKSSTVHAGTGDEVKKPAVYIKRLSLKLKR